MQTLKVANIFKLDVQRELTQKKKQAAT